MIVDIEALSRYLKADILDTIRQNGELENVVEIEFGSGSKWGETGNLITPGTLYTNPHNYSKLVISNFSQEFYTPNKKAMFESELPMDFIPQDDFILEVIDDPVGNYGNYYYTITSIGFKTLLLETKRFKDTHDLISSSDLKSLDVISNLSRNKRYYITLDREVSLDEIVENFVIIMKDPYSGGDVDRYTYNRKNEDNSISVYLYEDQGVSEPFWIELFRLYSDYMYPELDYERDYSKFYLIPKGNTNRTRAIISLYFFGELEFSTNHGGLSFLTPTPGTDHGDIPDVILSENFPEFPTRLENIADNYAHSNEILDTNDYYLQFKEKVSVGEIKKKLRFRDKDFNILYTPTTSENYSGLFVKETEGGTIVSFEIFDDYFYSIIHRQITDTTKTRYLSFIRTYDYYRSTEEIYYITWDDIVIKKLSEMKGGGDPNRGI